MGSGGGAKMRGRTYVHQLGSGANPGIDGMTYTKEKRAAAATRPALHVRCRFTGNVLRENPALSIRRSR